MIPNLIRNQKPSCLEVEEYYRIAMTPVSNSSFIWIYADKRLFGFIDYIEKYCVSVFNFAFYFIWFVIWYYSYQSIIWKEIKQTIIPKKDISIKLVYMGDLLNNTFNSFAFIVPTFKVSNSTFSDISFVPYF